MKKMVALFSVLYFGIVSVTAQTWVGYVLEVEGDWSLNGSAERLTQGRKLPGAGVIRLQANSTRNSSSISIADMNGRVIITRNCAVNSCSRPFALPRESPPAGISGFFSSWMEWFFGSPAKYSAHRSRSGEISDGVLLLSDGKIDFSPVLAKQGEVYLRWRAVSKKDAGEWSKPVKLEKSEKSLVLAATSDLKPGLYEFDLLRKSVGEIYEPVSTAWILIRDSSDFEKASASFRQAVELTKNWGDKIKPETAEIFLRAHLDQLAQSSKRTDK